MFALRPTAIPGCIEIAPRIHSDPRGTFVKTLHEPFFREHGLRADFREAFHSLSHRGVLRGLHFQSPPNAQVKLVHCVAGRALDAVVDLRVGSPTFGAHALVELDAARANLLYIPEGLAHGFYAPDDDTVMVYFATLPHSPDDDTGVLWSSAGIDWPDAAPLVSDRDRAFPAMAAFASPFRYGGGHG